jgi:Tol biopolymer transport system component
VKTPPTTQSEKPQDRGKIAFVRIFSTDSGDRGDIFAVRPDGSGLTSLTGPEGWDSYPAWSPEGDRLLFVRTSHRPSDIDKFVSELYLVNPDGTGLKSVLRTDWSTLRPAWSPDGKRIVLAGTAHERNYNLYVINIDGTTLTKVTDGPVNKEMPAWSPDGSLIAFVTPIENEIPSAYPSVGHAIWIMNADGTGQRQLTEGLYSDFFPSWSPDGSTILFSRSLEDERIPAGRGWTTASALCVMSADGAEMTRVTHDSAVYDSPGWSPDGSNIVCCKYEGGSKYICVMNADGSDQRAVTSPVGTHDYDPSWRRSA